MKIESKIIQIEREVSELYKIISETVKNEALIKELIKKFPKFDVPDLEFKINGDKVIGKASGKDFTIELHYNENSSVTFNINAIGHSVQAKILLGTKKGESMRTYLKVKAEMIGGGLFTLPVISGFMESKIKSALDDVLDQIKTRI